MEAGLHGEAADPRAGAGNIQDEPGASVVPESKGVLKIINK